MKHLPLLLLACCVGTLAHATRYMRDGKDCVQDKHGNEQCFKPSEYPEDEDDDMPMFYDEESNVKTKKEPLFIWDPVRVGYERHIEVSPGHTVTMVTKAVKPKVFMIENFLTEEETEHIKAKATLNGLSSSALHIDTKIRTDKDYISGKAMDSLSFRSQWDQDGNGVITVQEVVKTAEQNIKLYINTTEVQDMFTNLKMTEMDDGIITIQEFNAMDINALGGYMMELRENHPRFRDRFSEQIWLKHSDASDTIMSNLREKVIKITNLPRYIVEGGEPLQVLKYSPHGHYHAHFDGQDPDEYPDKQCCHLDLASQPFDCKLCRLLTIIYYLNDVEEGGETAFPVADKEGYVEPEFRQRKGGDLYNLSEFCYNSSLVVSPKKGRAVMFYNHHLDEEGFLGAMDQYSLHGGCDIRKGIKWMANNWITAPPAKYKDMESLYALIDPEGAF